MWRSLNLHQERTVPQVCPDWLSPPGGCSPGHTGWCSYHYPFCLHPRQQQPYYQRSVTSEQKHQRTDTYLGWLQWTQLFVGQSWCWHRGEVIERFTDKHNLCVLNDGTHTYLKPQAQHVNKLTSAIDLTISTPGLALRSAWEVLPDTHGSDHYPILTSILPSAAETQPSYDPSHWVFSKADWEQFHDLCLEGITEDILEEADPLHCFVEIITKAANDSIPRATMIPKKSNPWFDEEYREALKARRVLDKKVRQSRELRGEILSAFRRSQAKARRLINQKKRQSCLKAVNRYSYKACMG